MREKIVQATFSLSGLSFGAAALGFLSGVVQLFININDQVSIKWLLFMVWIALTFGMILLKIVYDLHNEKKPAALFEKPIRYIPESQTLLIRRNDNFLNNIIVGCYFQQDEIDTLAFIGSVYIIQEKVIQIKIIGDFIGAYTAPTSQNSLDRLVVKSVIPFDAFNQIQSSGN
jgi:hypothetical protein